MRHLESTCLWHLICSGGLDLYVDSNGINATTRAGFEAGIALFGLVTYTANRRCGFAQ